MDTRRLLLILPLLLTLGACSSDDPSSPNPTRTGLGFDSFATGAFVADDEAGFHAAPDDFEGPADGLTVVEISGGNLGLKDADTANAQAARFVITSANQQLFTFESIDVCDLSGLADVTPGSEIRVRGYRSTQLVATRYYHAASAAVVTEDAGSLQGLALTALRIDIKSTGDDDFCVGYVELAPVAERMLDFVDVPTGSFEHLYLGDYELTWTAGAERPLVVDHDAAPFAGDDTSDLLSSIFVVERTDGGAMRLEGLVGIDLEGAETHVDSRILVEGYDGADLVASEEYRPDAVEPTDFGAGSLAGLEVTILRLDVKSVCGQFKCDDMGVVGLLITNLD